MIFGAAREADVDAILELERGAFPTWERWGRQAWLDELAADDRFVITARDADDRVMAVATFQCVRAEGVRAEGGRAEGVRAEDVRGQGGGGEGSRTGDDTADLHRIMVAREHRGEGAAKKMMRAGMEWASAIGAGRMLLEVREDNEAALGLYDDFGFELLARRENYYGPGVHALVMAAELGKDGPLGPDEHGWNDEHTWNDENGWNHG